MSAKVAEAKEHVKAAEDSLKTGLLKLRRTPDYDTAADEFAKAATAFRAAREFKQAQVYFVRAADIMAEHLHSFYHAAKNLETAGLLAKEVKNYDEAATWFAKAGRLMREGGNSDSASILLDRGAKVLEEPLPASAARLYADSADASEAEDKFGEAADSMGNACRMFVRQKQLDEAAAAAKVRVEFSKRSGSADSLTKSATALIVLQLARDDLVAATQAFHDSVAAGFGSSDNCGPLGQLLAAMEQMDGDSASRAIQHPVFKCMDNELARLARDLKLPPKGSGGGGGGADDNGGAGAEGGHEEDFDGGLC